MVFGIRVNIKDCATPILLQDRLAATLAMLHEQQTAILVAALAIEDRDGNDGAFQVACPQLVSSSLRHKACLLTWFYGRQNVTVAPQMHQGAHFYLHYHVLALV